MKFLVAGCGSIGRRHVQNLLALDNDVIAYDPLTKNVQALAAHPKLRQALSFEDGLAEHPQAVIVATPTALHIAPALAAVRGGCDVFVEKPLSHTREGVDELVGEAERLDRVTMVGCNMRFHPNLRFIKTYLELGHLGRVYSVSAEVGSYLPGWRPQSDYRQNYAARRSTGGGVLLDSIHELDFLQWWFGDLDDVRCFAGHVSNLEIETEDLAVIALRFKSGVLGTLQLDYLQRNYSRQAKIVGELGTLRWDMNLGTVELFSSTMGSWDIVHRLPNGYAINQIYVDEMSEFINSVRTRRQPMSNFAEARNVLNWTLRCQEDAGLVNA